MRTVIIITRGVLRGKEDRDDRRKSLENTVEEVYLG